MKTNIGIEIKEMTVLQLIKCNVLVAEIANYYSYDKNIHITGEEKYGNVLYTYETITDEGLKINIEFDRYMFLEITEEN